jgi:DNA-binding NtrC family response regulator
MPSTIEVVVLYDPPNRSYSELKGELIAKFERKFIELTLTESKGNLSAAAKSLRMDRKHLNAIAKKHGLR